MPYNSLSSNYVSEKKILFRGLFPEGFSFFTRNPREPQALIFEAASKKDIIQTNKLYVNSLLGFNRYSRSVLIELGTLIHNYPKVSYLKKSLILEIALTR